MNAKRRKDIARAKQNIDQAIDVLTNARNEEEDAFGNLPESMQLSSKGDDMNANVDCLDSAITCLEDAIDNLSDIEGM